MPLTEEHRMNAYIDIHLKSTPDGVKYKDIDKRDSVLLRIIHPTQEQQAHDDRVGTERVVSTTIAFVKDKYKLSELRLVYRALRDTWNQ